VAPDGGAETRVHQHDASNSEVLMVNPLPTTTNLDMVLSSVHPWHQSSYPPLTNMQTYAGLGMFLKISVSQATGRPDTCNLQ
jgi:hypothetical protein